MSSDWSHGVSRGVGLSSHLTIGTGGAAAYFATARSVEELRQLLAEAERRRTKVLVLGGGSNLVVADKGFSGLVIAIALRGIKQRPCPAANEHIVVTAGAGEPWDALVAHTVERQLAGLECLSGIPGLVGATPIQNVGAYGQDVSQTITEVKCVERSTGKELTFANGDCAFAYRTSRFKTVDAARFVITEVTFRLRRDGTPRVRYPELKSRLSAAGLTRPTLAQVRQIVLATRADKSMLLLPDDPNRRSCGSFFVNPVIAAEQFRALSQTLAQAPPSYPQPDGRVKLPAAWLIEHAGFAKGTRQGNVGLSSKHTLALVAHPGATSAEIIAFAQTLKRAVFERFGIVLSVEPNFVGSEPP